MEYHISLQRHKKMKDCFSLNKLLPLMVWFRSKRPLYFKDVAMTHSREPALIDSALERYAQRRRPITSHRRCDPVHYKESGQVFTSHLTHFNSVANRQ